MISKTRRNRISKNSRNKNSKNNRISGGEKDDEYTWNLGICLIKKKKGSSKIWNDNDVYWIEYPTDPLPEGWIQEKCHFETILPVYAWVGTDVNKYIPIYPGITHEDYRKLTQEEDRTFWRPLSEAGDVKMTEAAYKKKLRENNWENTQVVSNSTTTGLKNFITSMFVFKQRTRKTSHASGELVVSTGEQWFIRSPGAFLYKFIFSLNDNDVPREFKKLYKMVSNWNFKFNPLFDYSPF